MLTPKPACSDARDHGRQVVGQDVAEPVLRVDVVVAGKQVAVVLDDQRAAALSGMDADRRGVADPGVERPLEVHDEDRADVLAHPLLVDGDEEVAVLLRQHRPGGDLRVRLLPVEGGRAGQVQAERLLGGRRQALDDRDELDELDPFRP